MRLRYCRHPVPLRLSVGIEAVEDIWTDLDRALRSVPEVEEWTQIVGLRVLAPPAHS